VPEEWTVPLNQVVLGGSHNSYSGHGGTLRDQLDGGVRCLELDIHDNSYVEKGGYRLGHNSPGDDVAASENGVGLLLGDWLDLVVDWSKSNGEHAPITVVIDIKDNLTDNNSAEEGNLGALNVEMRERVGTRLWSPEDTRQGWPQVYDMRGKILVQLSGDQLSRTRYLRDPGSRPAVAMNDKGQVIEVHDSGTGSLWYWTGQMRSDGSIQWFHHGRYDSGEDPAVALDEDGWIVEVHKSESQNHLWAHVAQLHEDYTVTWGDSKKFDSDGTAPSVEWQSDDSLVEIHRSSSGSQNVRWSVAIDRSDFSLSFSEKATTSQSQFVESETSSSAGDVRVYTASDAEEADSNTLQYGTHQVSEERIRYEQLAFVDYQPLNAVELLSGGILFYNTQSGGMADAQDWLNNGWLVRMWGFDQDDVDLNKKQPTCPATDDPKAVWYNTYLRDVGALR